MDPWTCGLSRQASYPGRLQRSGRADTTMGCMGGPLECKILSIEVRTSGQSHNKAVLFPDWEQRMALTHATACALGVKLSCFPARWCKCVSALGNEVSSRFAEVIRGFWAPVLGSCGKAGCSRSRFLSDFSSQAQEITVQFISTVNLVKIKFDNDVKIKKENW